MIDEIEELFRDQTRTWLRLARGTACVCFLRSLLRNQFRQLRLDFE